MNTIKYNVGGLLDSLSQTELISKLGNFKVDNVKAEDLDLKGMKSLGKGKGKSVFNLGKAQTFMKGTGTALKMFGALDKVVGGVVDITGLGTDEIDLSAADRFGFKKGQQFEQLINRSGFGKLFTAVGGFKQDELKRSAYENTVGSGFTASKLDMDAANAFSGKRIAIGAEKAQTALVNANAQSALISQIGYETEMAKNNGNSEIYQQQNFNKYSGTMPRLLPSGKSGLKIVELEDAKNILVRLSKQSGISKFQLGGKIIDPSKNIIPDGALHKNRNHLSEHNDELKDQITEKGIPVVSENADGTITQHAEVEVGEVIFNLANTKIIEDYWQQYKETGDDSIAIECGKFLTKELLRNTVDKAGIKKNIE